MADSQWIAKALGIGRASVYGVPQLLGQKRKWMP